MGKDTFWLNKAGDFAQYSNRNGNVPAYALSMDVATAPWDNEEQFGALITSEQQDWRDMALDSARGIGASGGEGLDFTINQAVLQIALKNALVNPEELDAALQEGMVEYEESMEPTGWWGGVTDVVGAVGDAASWTKEAAESTIEKIPGGETALDVASETAPFVPGPRQIMWASHKFNEYGSTLIVAHDREGLEVTDIADWDNQLAEAHAIVKRNSLNIGDTFMLGITQDSEIYTDQERLDKLRATNGLYNVGALATEIAITWKLDPLVLGGRLASFTRRRMRGDLSLNPANRAVEASVIGAATKADAKAKVFDAKGIKERLAAKRGLTLWDSFEEVRQASTEMPFEDFTKLTMFRRNPNGTVMADLIKKAAENDEHWNILKRTLVGDATAVKELESSSQEIADLVNGINNLKMPRLQHELTILEAKRDKLIEEAARFGEPEAPGPGGSTQLTLSSLDESRLLSGNMDWLDESIDDQKLEINRLSDQLSRYAEHDEWFNGVLDGIDSGAGSASMLGALDTVGTSTPLGSRFTTAAHEAGKSKGKWEGEETPKTHFWQSSWFSPVSTITSVPRGWALKTNNLMFAHDVHRSSDSMTNFMDTMEHLTGRRDPPRRSEILEGYVGASDEIQRGFIANEVQGQAVRMLGRKHGMEDDEALTRFAQHILAKQEEAWKRLATMNRSITKSNGETVDMLEFYDDGGALHRVQSPLSATELKDSSRMIDLLELDRLMRRHKDFLQEWGRAGRLWMGGRRAATGTVIEVGERFNSLWKPWALLSLRWPLRVFGDEGTRATLVAGSAFPLEAAKSLGYFFNNGFVRSTEWVGGKLVKTKAGDSLRLGNRPHDALDDKMSGNPAGTVPASVVNLEATDPKRYKALLALKGQREDEWVNGVMVRAKGGTPARARWQQRIEDRIGESERTNAGFIMDPLNDTQTTRRGFATSVFPGRMSTLPGRPAAHDVNAFVDANLDVLQDPKNKIGIWRDTDRDVWVLDVVRHHSTKDSADAEVAAAGVGHFFDVGDGFRRYDLDEEMPATPDKQGKLRVRKSGIGQRRYISRDGKAITADSFGGANTDNPLIQLSLAGSHGAVQNMFGSHTKGISNARNIAMQSEWKTIQPTNVQEWADATARYANRHLREDPVWLRMLNGQTDRQLVGWLRTADGRRLRERVGKQALDPDAYVTDMRSMLNKILPTKEARDAAREGDLDPKKVQELIPEGVRSEIQGAALDTYRGLGLNESGRGVMNTLMKWLGSNFSDRFTRHPFAQSMYDLKLRNLVASTPGEQLTNKVMRGYQNTARQFSLQQVRRYMFDMSDEWNSVRMFRFLAPFFNAQVEVLDRYLKLIGDRPEALGKLLGTMEATGGAHGPILQTYDEEGNPIEGWSANGYIVTQLPMGAIKQVPYFGELAKYYDGVPIPTSSINLILQGENPWMPGWGPMVTVPIAETVRHFGGPETLAQDWYKTMFPYGTPRDAIDAIMPAWGRRVRTLMEGSKDPAYGTELIYQYATMVADWERTGRKGKEPEWAEAKRIVDKLYQLRAVTGFTSPVPIAPDTKYQPYIDEFRKMTDKYGDSSMAQRKFYQKYKDDPYLFLFTTTTTKINNDMPPNALAAAAYEEYKPLFDKAPRLGAVLAGPGSWSAEYDYDIYRWQLAQPVTPGSSDAIREKLSPEAAIETTYVNRGWIEYSKLSSAIDVELRRRGLVTLGDVQERAMEMSGTVSPEAMQVARQDLLSNALSTDAAIDLRRWKNQMVDTIAERNPGWENDYRSRDDTLGEWIDQAKDVAFDDSLDGRTDIDGLRNYLILRRRMVARLMNREQRGGSGGLFSEGNEDLAVLWYSQTRELVSQNLLFAEVWHRYLEDDDLEASRF